MEQRYFVRENWDRRRVNIYGGGCTLLFFVIILFFFLSLGPLAWIWILLLFPLGGWGWGYYYVPVKTVKTVTTYNPLNEPINEPRSPRAGRDTPEGIEMTELKF